MDTWYVNGRPFQPERLLGKGKGGYSYLVSSGGQQYVRSRSTTSPAPTINSVIKFNRRSGTISGSGPSASGCRSCWMWTWPGNGS